MKTITPPIKFKEEQKSSDSSIVVVKQDVQLISSIVSYEDPYQSLYEFMIEEID